MQFNIVYKTINLINNKFYIGKHVQHDTSAFDGYLGSGTLLWEAIEEFGIENFIRETIEFLPTEKEAYQREFYWSIQLSATNRDIGYNLVPGGYGFTSEDLKARWKDEDYKRYRSELMKLVMVERWKEEEFRSGILKSITIAQNRPEVKEKINEKKKLYYSNEENRKNLSEKCFEIQNRPEVKEKKSKSMKGKFLGNKFNAHYYYVLKDPTGIIYQCDELKQFCKDFNLTYERMWAVTNGKIKEYRGWKCLSKIRKSTGEELFNI